MTRARIGTFPYFTFFQIYENFHSVLTFDNLRSCPPKDTEFDPCWVKVNIINRKKCIVSIRMKMLIIIIIFGSKVLSKTLVIFLRQRRIQPQRRNRTYSLNRPIAQQNSLHTTQLNADLRQIAGWETNTDSTNASGCIRSVFMVSYWSLGLSIKPVWSDLCCVVHARSIHTTRLYSSASHTEGRKMLYSAVFTSFRLFVIQVNCNLHSLDIGWHQYKNVF